MTLKELKELVDKAIESHSEDTKGLVESDYGYHESDFKESGMINGDFWIGV